MTQNYSKFEYSKRQVIKASQRLVENNVSLEEKNEAIKILADFRSFHEYPMQSMINYFRKKSFEVDKNAIVVRRLKRIPSIINKLKRFETMKVTTMGDIGGVRIITSSLANVQKIKAKLLAGRTRNKLISEKDYLTQPKDSGYRGVHLTYGYRGKKQEYTGYRVELQIRSKIQHAWATAVEVVGTFLHENLKASQGDERLLEFFKTASLVFARQEEAKPIDDELQNTLNQQVKNLQLFDALESFSIVAKHSDEKDGLYLIELNVEEKRVSSSYYKPSFLVEALETYRRIEQEASEDSNKDVVLVSAESLKELKKAYPNYFANTQLFVSQLREVLNLENKG